MVHSQITHKHHRVILDIARFKLVPITENHNNTFLQEAEITENHNYTFLQEADSNWYQ